MGNVKENFETQKSVIVKRLRSVHVLHQMIQADDPETEVTEYLIRKLIYEGEIPSVLTGNKRLSCFEDLAAYLYEGKRWPEETIRS